MGESVNIMILKVWAVPGIKVPPPNERTLKILMSPELGNTDKLTVLASIIPAGGTTGLHTHDVDEFMYVVSGRGVHVYESKEFPVEVDMLIHAPAGIRHEVKNTGDETIKLVCFFVPPLKPTGYLEKAVEAAKEAKK